MGSSSQRLQHIDAFFAAKIERKRVPAPLLRSRATASEFTSAFGQSDPVKGTAMTTDNLFHLASMTKIEAVVAALALTEQGKLPLQGKLGDYFPSFASERQTLDEEVVKYLECRAPESGGECPKACGKPDL